MAVAKHNYQFLYVNVGCQGRLSDGAVFKATDLYEGITQKSLDIPKPRKLPKSGDACWDEDSYEAVPFAIVGDNAFQLSNHMLKPYKGRSLTDEQIILNYRLSRFRRCVENAFGILVARFRVFHSRINLWSTAKVNKVILAGVVLHNMLCEMSRHSYIPTDFADQEDPITGEINPGIWRSQVPESFGDHSPVLPGCRGTRQAEKYRDVIRDFINGPGALPWQDNVLV